MDPTRTQLLAQTENLKREISRLKRLLAVARAEPSADETPRADGERRTDSAVLADIGESRGESRQVARALLESEKILRGILDNVEDAVMTIDGNGTLLSFNPSAEKIFGYRAEETLGRGVEMLMPEPHRSRHGGYIRAYEQSGESQILGKGPRELEGLRKDGERFPLDLSISEMRLGGRRRFIGTIRDISERTRAERAFRENAEELDTIYQSAGVGIVIADREGRFIRCNKKFEELLGYGEEELKATNVPNVSYPDDIEEDMRLRREIFAGRRHSYQLDKRLIRKDGAVVWILATIVALKNADGEIAATVGIAENITGRKRAEATLEASERRYRNLFETSLDGILINDAQGFIEDANPAILDLLGYGMAELRGKNVDDITPPKWRALTREIREQLRRGPHDVYEKEYIRRDGTTVPVTVHAWPVGGREGRHESFMAIIRDITKTKQVEAQLRQAQKMEAIGQLTGGVAHDFNNLLTVISGNLEMIADEVGADAELSAMAARAIRAAERGAALTQRLLAFSRKQVLQPKIVAVDSLVHGMMEMLRRTLGESIEIEATHGDGDLHCEVDAAQLESAILNLAINARDSMPRGGRLAISVSRTELDEDAAAALDGMAAGAYALLRVSDTGFGIEAEILNRVFDPFFTTKEVGKGSGLGLSMVYGFAKQSGGHATIRSRVDGGTTVSIYLPMPASP